MDNPAETSKKYDRQLRVWGTHGQAALEHSNVCLMHSGPTACEAMKNLVLGGIHSFTVVDDAIVTEADLGNNFLVEQDSLGQPRARAVMQLLRELNPSVVGDYMEESPEGLLASNPTLVGTFSLVIACQMQEPAVLALEEACRANNVPLLIARSYGLVGYLRISVAEHTVIESRPDNSVDDLRFHRPWRELDAYVRSIDLDALDAATHQHVPYAVLLIKAMERWRERHRDGLPRTAKDKATFLDILRSMQRSGGAMAAQEENFKEAVDNARKVFVPPSIPSEVRALFDDPCAHLTATSSPFWVLVAALKAFVAEQGAGALPLEGSIPDMTAATGLYLELQRLYRERADADAAAVAAHARRLAVEAGTGPPPLLALVRTFVKNARNLRVVRLRTLAEEVAPEANAGEALRQALAGEDTAACAALYLLLRAADRFVRTYNRPPGAFDGEREDDVALLKMMLGGVVGEAGLAGAPGAAVADDYVAEMVRFGGAELHCVAAIVGGMAAQESIKLLTSQFVPLRGTLIYNAMASASSVLVL